MKKEAAHSSKDSSRAPAEPERKTRSGKSIQAPVKKEEPIVPEKS